MSGTQKKNLIIILALVGALAGCITSVIYDFYIFFNSNRCICGALNEEGVDHNNSQTYKSAIEAAVKEALAYGTTDVELAETELREENFMNCEVGTISYFINACVGGDYVSMCTKDAYFVVSVSKEGIVTVK